MEGKQRQGVQNKVLSCLDPIQWSELPKCLPKKQQNIIKKYLSRWHMDRVNALFG